jgi:hypothetical protein
MKFEKYASEILILPFHLHELPIEFITFHINYIGTKFDFYSLPPNHKC